MVTRNGAAVATLMPEQRIFPVAQMPTTEAGIDHSLMRDLYLVIGDRQENGGWAVRSYIEPFVKFIWIGCFLMAIGGLLSACRTGRYRVAVVRAAPPLRCPRNEARALPRAVARPALPAAAVQPDEILPDPALEARAVPCPRGCAAWSAATKASSRAMPTSRAICACCCASGWWAGDTDDEAIAFIVDRYGEYVLLTPTTGGANLILWLAGRPCSSAGRPSRGSTSRDAGRHPTSLHRP